MCRGTRTPPTALPQGDLDGDRDGQAERQQPENVGCAWSLAPPPASWLKYRHESR